MAGLSKLSRSFSAGTTSGVGLASNGSIEVESAMLAAVSQEAVMGAATDLSVQLADGASAAVLTGPLLQHGEAVKLFAGDLGTLMVQKKHPSEAAEPTVMICRTLSA